MFFDPLGKRVQFSGDHTGRRPVQRHPLLRLLAALIVLAVLIGDALIHVVRPAAVQAADGIGGFSEDQFFWAMLGAAGAILAIVVSRLRGFVFLLARGAALACAYWCLTGNNEFQDLRELVQQLVPGIERGLLRDGLLLSAATLAGESIALLVWWLYGTLFGYAARYDTLLGHPVKLRLPAEEVVAFVVYPELAVYELITFAEYHAAAAIPIRRTWLLLLPGEASDGPLREEQWTDALKGRAHIFCLYDVKRWRGTGHAGHAWSLLHPFFDGVCCKRTGTEGGLTQQRDLIAETRKRIRNFPMPHNGHDLTRAIAVPRIGTPATLSLEVSPDEERLRVTQVKWDGFTLTPLAPWGFTESDRAALQPLFEMCRPLSLVVAVPPGKAVDRLRNLLQELIPQKYVRELRVNVPDRDDPLCAWVPWVGRLAGRIALSYLRWACDREALLPERLTIEPATGRIQLLEKSRADFWILDLDGSLLVHLGREAPPILLPLTNERDLASLVSQLDLLVQLVKMYPRAEENAEIADFSR